MLARSLGQSRHENRGKGRIYCENLECSLGKVRNLSGSGMRIERSGRRLYREGERLNVRITTREIETHVEGRITWSKRVGFWRHEFGLEFVDLTEEQSADLLKLAQLTARDSLLGLHAG